MGSCFRSDEAIYDCNENDDDDDDNMDAMVSCAAALHVYTSA